ncbi:hypothetical protein QBC36DRAFT_374322 [Triangularia setosa]|uniref:Uncharacterized protein n=1 Tax=Triangularia setosa TaxID=2587417 RepID=A0AAN6WHC9_9PEZI|nr:hypothetical protein QBC36DRAFT_374322 [Podospora setosa]
MVSPFFVLECFLHLFFSLLFLVPYLTSIAALFWSSPSSSVTTSWRRQSLCTQPPIDGIRPREQQAKVAPLSKNNKIKKQVPSRYAPQYRLIASLLKGIMEKPSQAPPSPESRL